MEIPQYLHRLSVEERQAWVPADVAGNAATSSDIDVHSVFDLKNTINKLCTNRLLQFSQISTKSN